MFGEGVARAAAHDRDTWNTRKKIIMLYLNALINSSSLWL